MKVDPGGAELLRVARDELLARLLPQLPESERYTARMVANAMAIAARELAHPVPAAIDTAALARAIRAGEHDAPDRDRELRAALRELTRARLAVSNPRILDKTRTP